MLITSPRRLPIVGVMGSGTEPWHAKARPLGEWLARRGVHLLTGGGGGVMAGISEAFGRVPERRGLVLGVLPCADEPTPTSTRAGYPNPWVELPIRTHLPFSGRRGEDPLSRNHINVLTADVIVGLPGGHGTLSELRLAQRYGRPTIAYVGGPEELPELPAGLPYTAEFSEVCAFVDQQLDRVAEARGSA